MQGTKGTIVERTRAFRRDEAGVTTIEYGLIAALVSIAIMAALAIYGDAVSQMYFTESGVINAVIDDVD
jgi:pilus assembly protein Flp/PilA